MFFLVLAIITSALVAATIKLFGYYKVDSFQAISINYIVCISASVLLTFDNPDLYKNIGNYEWLKYAIILGAGFIALFNLFAISAAKIGLALTAISSKMSVIIPVYIGIIIYHDKLDIYKITGIVFTFLAFYFIFKKDSRIAINKDLLKARFILPVLLFLGNGINDSLQTFTQKTYIMDNSLVLFFMLIIYLVAFGISLFIYIYKRMKGEYRIELRNIIAGISLGVFNFGTTFYFLKAIGYYPASYVFPIFNVSIVSITTLTGVIFFKERLKPINWFGIAIAVFAILLISY